MKILVMKLILYRKPQKALTSASKVNVTNQGVCKSIWCITEVKSCDWHMVSVARDTALFTTMG